MENNSSSKPPRLRGSSGWSHEFAVAMELPFVMVGTILFGGFLGYLLDRWLGTLPVFVIVLGLMGLFAGVREVMRRMNFNKPKSK
jgi:F0F1-type ATP synthase assembly protein I